MYFEGENLRVRERTSFHFLELHTVGSSQVGSMEEWTENDGVGVG